MNTNELFEMPADTNSSSSWADTLLAPNSTKEFLKIEDQGIVRQLWCTTFPKEDPSDSLTLSRQLILSIYWENANTPAISLPLADFFCQQAKLKAFSNQLFNASNDQMIFCSHIPMPFKSCARFEITNNSSDEIHFFFGVDIETKPLPSSILYLHTHFSEHPNHPSTEPIEVCPAYQGYGKYLGTHILVNQLSVPKFWAWYTRPIHIFADQDENAPKGNYFINTLDDYIASAWWDREGDHNEYCYPYFGRPHVDEKPDNALECSMYRYHLDAPLIFKESIRAKIGPNWNFNDQDIGPASWKFVSFLYANKPERT